MKPAFVDYVALLTLGLFWGTSFVAIEYALRGFSPIALATVRVVIATFLLFALLLYKKQSIPKGKRIWVIYTHVGITGLALPFLLINWAQTSITASFSAMIIACTPVITFIFATFFAKQHRFTFRNGLGLILGFLGVYFLLGGNNIFTETNDRMAEIAVLLAAFGYAYSGVKLRQASEFSATVNSACFSLTAALFLIPVALVFDPPWHSILRLDAVLGLIYMILISTVAGLLLMSFLIKRVGAPFMSLNNYLVPLFATIWGVILLDEVIMANMMTALFLILCGVTIVTSNGRKTAPKSS